MTDYSPDLRRVEDAVSERVGGLPIDFAAMAAISSLHRAANALRAHMTNSVLREHNMSWTGFVVLWTVWVWDGIETRDAAQSAAISKGTLSGVVTTLAGRGWLTKRPGELDGRLVTLHLTDEGRALMEELFPRFNAQESAVVDSMSARQVRDLTQSLRKVVNAVADLDGQLDAASS